MNIRSCKNLKNSNLRARGFALMTAIIITLVVSSLLVLVFILLDRSMRVSITNNRGIQAMSVSSGGLQQGLYWQLSPQLSDRIACSDLNSGTSTSAITTTTLSAALNDTATTMTVVNTKAYPTMGRLRIDKEFIDYTGKTATSFTGLTRGVANTTAATHAVSDNVVAGIGRGSYQTQRNTDSTSPYSPAPATTLNATINASVTSIAVPDTSTYAPRGRLIIDKEAIDYTGKTATTFTGLIRGADGTQARPHLASTRIGQYQCDLLAKGGVPDFTINAKRRRIAESVQLQAVWAVGNLGKISLWNSPAQILQWTPQANLLPDNLNALSMLNTTDGWAVGDFITSTPPDKFYLLHFNGVSWALDASVNPITPGMAGTMPYIRNLNAVAATSAGDIWAVGEHSDHTIAARQFTILHNNGTNWCLLGPGSTPLCESGLTIPAGAATNADLFALSMKDTDQDGVADIGMAVGAGGTALLFNRTSASTGAWTASSTGTLSNLYSVDLVSATDVWVVGDGGVIFHFNGTTWTAQTSPVTTALRSVKMIDTNGDGVANLGYAVGAGGVVLRYDGTSWSLMTTPITTDLFGVTVITANDVWAVGAGGAVLHYNGVSWVLNPTGGTGLASALRAIASVGSKQHRFKANSAPQQAASAWYELFATP